MASLFDDLKKEFGKSAEIFSEKMNEFSETAKGQFEIINLKKDRYLHLKELGDRVYNLATTGALSTAESDAEVTAKIEEIRTLTEKIDKLEKQNA
jgi:hypothetical protein